MRIIMGIMIVACVLIPVVHNAPLQTPSEKGEVGEVMHCEELKKMRYIGNTSDLSKLKDFAKIKR